MKTNEPAPVTPFFGVCLLTIFSLAQLWSSCWQTPITDSKAIKCLDARIKDVIEHTWLIKHLWSHLSQMLWSPEMGLQCRKGDVIHTQITLHGCKYLKLKMAVYTLISYSIGPFQMQHTGILSLNNTYFVTVQTLMDHTVYRLLRTRVSGHIA